VGVHELAQLARRHVVGRERRQGNGLGAKRARAAEVTREIERLVALAARVDGVEELAGRLEALKREQRAPARRCWRR